MMQTFTVLSVLLAATATTILAGPLDSSAPSSVATTALDSINQDLENLKVQLNRTISSSREKWDAINKKFDSEDGTEFGSAENYILQGEEQKDKAFTECAKPSDGDNIYRYNIPLLNESLGLMDFSEHRNRPILIVNVATFCESTIEYPLYNELKEKYGDKLTIVGFPSNNFANQEPSGDAVEIYNAIKFVRPGKGFIPKFPLTKRIDVNGEKAHPIYSFLKRSCPSTRNRYTANEHYLLYKPRNARDIRWNFEKFLIHPATGEVWRRYDQKTLPNKMIPDIEVLIKAAEKISE